MNATQNGTVQALPILQQYTLLVSGYKWFFIVSLDLATKVSC